MAKINKVAIVTDSSCDLSDELIQRYNLHTLPLRVISSEGEFKDGVDITPEQLYDLMKREIPKTSLPLPEDIHQLYASLMAQGYTDILHFSISSKLSGSYNVSTLIAREFEEENDIAIHVVDTLTLSAGLGLIVLNAAKMLEENATIEEVIARSETLRKGQLGCFVVKTLEYLRKGGRIGLVDGVVGNLLKIRPVILVNSDGIYETLAKARGYEKAIETLFGEFVRKFTGRKINLAVVHGAALNEATLLLERLKSTFDIVDSYIFSVSPALAIHTGPGLVGIIAQDA